MIQGSQYGLEFGAIVGAGQELGTSDLDEVDAPPIALGAPRQLATTDWMWN